MLLRALKFCGYVQKFSHKKKHGSTQRKTTQVMDVDEVRAKVISARTVSPLAYAALGVQHAAFLAAYNGHLAVLQAQLDRPGAPSVNCLDPELRTTMLHAAAANGSVDVVKWLLDAGAGAQSLDADGETPLERVLCTCRWEDAKDRAIAIATHPTADAAKTAVVLGRHLARPAREPVDFARAAIADACLRVLEASAPGVQ